MFRDSEIRDSQVKTQPPNNRRFQVQDAPPTGMERTVPCEVRKESELESAVRELDMALDRHEKEMRRLFERISPVLRPNNIVDGCEAAEAKQPEISPLAERLLCFSRRIQYFTRDITRVDERLAL